MLNRQNGQRLAAILEWAIHEGEVRALDRIRVQVLPLTLAEGLVLTRLGPDTECSNDVVEAVRKAAEDVVGRPCPQLAGAFGATS